VTNAIGMIDMEDTRVPIAIPLVVIGGFGIFQLALGTDPLILALCAVSIAAPLIPLHLYGRDLYSMIGILFSLRYTGVALMAKSFYGQTLDSHLFDAYSAFGLNALLMLIMTGVILIARALDPGKEAFPFPTDLQSLRRLSTFCFCFGLVTELFVATKSADGSSGGGSLFVIASSFAEFLFLGMIAETVYAIKKSEGRSFVTVRMALMLGVVLAIVLALNMRGFLLSCLIGIVVTAFIYRMLRLRHILIGVVIAIFFTSILTPITLYLRMQKEGVTRAQFVELAKDTVIKAATDPSFFRAISQAAEYAAFSNIKSEVEYDYYGDRSNVLNRLSFIGLLDAAAYSAHGRRPIGMPAVNQSLARNAPGFLGFDKSDLSFGMGDWLSWQMDMGTYGIPAFLNFGLPMEGLATWGLIGFVAYPFVLSLIILLICGRISSLKLPLPTSIFLFTSLQTAMIEDTSDGYLSVITRGLPTLLVGLFLTHKILFPRGAGAQSASIAASTTN